MDVEGYEYQIIKWMKKILRSNKPLKIFIELHIPQLGLASKENVGKIINTFKRYNFKIKAIFLEPEPSNYKSLKLTNKLSEFIGIPKLGFGGNSYEDLSKLINSKELNCAPMLFLERK